MKLTSYAIIVLILIVNLAGLGLAEIPLLLNYQGKMLDSENNNLTARLEMTFSLYEDTTAAAIWSETQPVNVQSGIFHVLLGSTEKLEPSFFAMKELFLGVKIGNSEEMKPRIRLTSVAYAINSEKLDGKGVADFANASHTHNAGDISDGSGSGLDADLLDGNDSADFAAAAHNHAASDINDGSGSGLDADLLDGKDSATFANAIHKHAASDIDDGAGSGLDADLFDGKDSNEFLNTSNDAGRQGVAATLYEGSLALNSKYIRKSPGAISQEITSGNSESTLSVTNTGSGKGLITTSRNIGIQSIADGQQNGPIYGIYASATNRFTSNNSDAYAIYAESISAVGGGIKVGLKAVGIDTAIIAHSIGANSYAGYFIGNVKVTGHLSTEQKSAYVDIDGNNHFLYCMESPEVWFEDFGFGQLRNGSSKIYIEPLFLKTISTEHAYHVFLTPYGNCNGLYIADLYHDSFEVRELNNGTASIKFSYRIVAKRKGYESYRLEKEENNAASAE